MDEGGPFTRVAGGRDDLLVERHGSAEVLRMAVVMALQVGPAEPSAVLPVGVVLADDSDEALVVVVDDFVLAVTAAVFVVEIAVEGPLDLPAEFPVFPV